MHLAELTEGDAQAIARWHYPAPYDCYDSPGWDRMAREGWAICDVEARRTQFRALQAGASDDSDPASSPVLRANPDGAAGPEGSAGPTIAAGRDGTAGTDSAAGPEVGAGLAGYVRFRPADDGLMVHLGLRPDLCGRGLGREFLGLVVTEARRRALGAPVRLLVRRFNARAIAAYRRAGFVAAGGTGGAVEGTSAGDPQERLVMVLVD